MDNFINPKDLIYPIGSVYFSKCDELNNCSAHDPSQVFGGVWEEIYSYKGLCDNDLFVDSYYLDNSLQYGNFYNNEKTKVRYYLRIA